jgi:PAS domain S-box-containing protein
MAAHAAMPDYIPAPPLPPEQERRRLARLRLLQLLDTQPEPLFDGLVRLASEICGVPISLVSMIDEHRQWFKANRCLEGVSETARDVAFCGHAIHRDEIMEVPDAALDARFARNPLVEGDPNIRFYAGAPITMPDGERIGTLCVIDRAPRALTDAQRRALRQLADVARDALLQREELLYQRIAADESHFNALLDRAPLGIFQATDEGEVFYTNPEWTAIFGTLDDGDWIARVHGDDAPRVRAGWQALVAGGAVFDEEFRVAGDGPPRFVRSRARSMTWGRPARQGFVGTAADVTPRRTAQDRLRLSEERQKRALEGARLALWDLDLDSGQLYLSESWSEMLGRPGEPTTTTFEALAERVPEADQWLITGALSAALKDDAEYDIEHRVRTDDGRLIWIHSKGRVNRRDAEGRALHASGTNEDITARKSAEEEAQRAAAITRATLETTNDGVVVVNQARQIMLHNRQLARMWDLPEHEPLRSSRVVGEAIRRLLVSDAGYIERIDALYAARDEIGSDLLVLNDGRSVERHSRPMMLPDGSVGGRVWTFRDVTQQRAAQEAIVRAKEEAEAASRAKSEFLATVSHEIRTPLNGVLGIVKLLLGEKMEAAQRRYAELIDTSARSLLTLVNDVLDLEKIEAGHVVLERIAFSPRALAADLADLYALRASEKDLVFESTVAPDVPDAVTGDPHRLRQVLSNLLSNALKFTAEGRIGLHVSVASRAKGHVTLRFAVRDSGIGIPAEVQGSLFSRFVQADSSTTRRYGGTGLGLAIVRQLTKRMGGRVTLASQDGAGSEFTCEIPFPIAEAAAVASAAPAPANEAPRAGRLLLVEDHAINQIVARGLLEQLGWKDVDIAEDGAQAVQRAAAVHYEAVLMDCHMPVMDGFEATRRLRESGFTRPILAMSAGTSEAERRKCFDSGMDDFLPKPLDSAALARMLDRHLGGGAAAAPAASSATAMAPVFGRAAALGRLGGDEEIFGLVLQQFLGTLHEWMPRVRQALEAGDAVTARRHLHTLAGSAATVGADRLHQEARRLEHQAEAGDLVGVADALAALEMQLNAFVDATSG